MILKYLFDTLVSFRFILPYFKRTVNGCHHFQIIYLAESVEIIESVREGKRFLRLWLIDSPDRLFCILPACFHTAV